MPANRNPNLWVSAPTTTCRRTVRKGAEKTDSAPELLMRAPAEPTDIRDNESSSRPQNPEPFGDRSQLRQHMSMMEGYSEVNGVSHLEPVCVRSPENTVSASDTIVRLRKWWEIVLPEDSNLASDLRLGDLRHCTHASAIQNCRDRQNQTSALPNLDSCFTDSSTFADHGIS
jgi:hypothetical protein